MTVHDVTIATGAAVSCGALFLLQGGGGWGFGAGALISLLTLIGGIITYFGKISVMSEKINKLEMLCEHLDKEKAEAAALGALSLRVAEVARNIHENVIKTIAQAQLDAMKAGDKATAVYELSVKLQDKLLELSASTIRILERTRP